MLVPVRAFARSAQGVPAKEQQPNGQRRVTREPRRSVGGQHSRIGDIPHKRIPYRRNLGLSAIPNGDSQPRSEKPLEKSGEYDQAGGDRRREVQFVCDESSGQMENENNSPISADMTEGQEQD
jgi:hypothetical protein